MLLAALSFLAATQAPAIEWSPYTLNVEGKDHACELGKLKVPENRLSQESRQIELAMIRLKAKGASPGPPLIYLDGGPGSAATGLARSGLYFELFDKLREVGDVILLDQRGVGLSRPRLSYLTQIPIPGDFFETEAAFSNLWSERAKEAMAIFKRDPGADPAGYNTEQSADDVNDIRRALGADTIRILGFSYGTHLGLSVLRRHEQHIAAAVLIGTEGPDDTLKPPVNGDRQIEKIAAEVAKDPQLSKAIPDFTVLVKECMRKLEREPVTVTLKTAGGQEKPFKIGKYGLQHLICRDLGDTNDIPFFPAGFHALSKGDTAMLQRLAQRRYSQYAAGTPLMMILVDSSSGASPVRQRLVAAQAPKAIFGNAMNFVDAAAKAIQVPILPESFRQPIVTDVPTLFLSGDLDWNTPPEQAETVRQGFTNSTHIVVRRAGHESVWPHPAIRQAINDFFLGKDVSGVDAELDWKFEPIRG